MEGDKSIPYRSRSPVIGVEITILELGESSIVRVMCLSVYVLT